MNASSTPARSRPQPDFGRPSAANWVIPATSSSPTSEFVASREAEMGEISDEDESDFAPVEVDVPAMDDEGAEDLFFGRSSFVH